MTQITDAGPRRFDENYRHFQWYAAVHFSTCPECLRRHGGIYPATQAAPPLHEGCRCQILPIGREYLDAYREKGERMRQKAEQELARRRLFRSALDQLRENFAESERLLVQASSIDVFLEEIEQLFRDQRDWLAAHLREREQLGRLFVRAYRMKFGLDKYQHLAAGMRAAQEGQGIERIRELFG